jgi:hypothetical protein
LTGESKPIKIGEEIPPGWERGLIKKSFNRSKNIIELSKLQSEYRRNESPEKSNRG